MGYYASSSGRNAARQAATLNAIVDYRYLAPARIAADETRERVLAEAAQTRLLSPATSEQRRTLSNFGRRDLKKWIARCGRWLERSLGARAIPNKSPLSLRTGRGGWG
jgi:hypothetical protein